MTELRVVTLTGADAALADSLVERFGAGLRGGVVRPGDAGYEESRRVWSGLGAEGEHQTVRVNGWPRSR